MSLLADVKFFNALLLKRRVKVDAGISVCGLLNAERKRDASRFAHVAHKPGLICNASVLAKQPTKRRRGLIAHELGHLLLLKKGNYYHSEHEADLEVEKRLGLKVKYDKKGIQTL